jgi:hypothetical protein
MGKRPSRWPVHVSLEVYQQLRLFAAARDITVAAATEVIVLAGLARKTQDLRRNEQRQRVRA